MSDCADTSSPGRTFIGASLAVFFGIGKFALAAKVGIITGEGGNAQTRGRDFVNRNTVKVRLAGGSPLIGVCLRQSNEGAPPLRFLQGWEAIAPTALLHLSSAGLRATGLGLSRAPR